MGSGLWGVANSCNYYKCESYNWLSSSIILWSLTSNSYKICSHWRKIIAYLSHINLKLIQKYSMYVRYICYIFIVNQGE